MKGFSKEGRAVFEGKKKREKDPQSLRGFCACGEVLSGGGAQTAKRGERERGDEGIAWASHEAPKRKELDPVIRGEKGKTCFFIFVDVRVTAPAVSGGR